MIIVQIGPFPVNSNCIHGGVESSVYGLAKELAKTHTVDVFDLPRLSGKNIVEYIDGMTIHRYMNPGKHHKDSASIIPAIIRDIVAIGPHVCHIHGTGTFSKEVKNALDEYGIRTIITVHGILKIEKRNALLKSPSIKTLYQFISQHDSEKSILKNSDIIIVDTQYVADQIKAHYSVSTYLNVIPQGINQQFAEIECSESSNIILSVGTFSRRKGHLFLLKSFEELCKDISNIKLVIAGVVADDSYYEELVRNLEKSEYKNNIQLMTNVSQQQLFELYKNAHIFALHSEEESQGIVFAEAMATGLPVVATAVGGIPYVVTDHKTGLLSKYGDTRRFAANLKKMLGEISTWKEYSANAKIEAQRYLWNNIANTVSNLY
ncbi:MAG: glycosyltransferase family 4 protein [Bacteroidales bacterium]|nr:glycosyltransferase family 4 protein [Candidatus Cacconaster merdequi]